MKKIAFRTLACATASVTAAAGVVQTATEHSADARVVGPQLTRTVAVWPKSIFGLGNAGLCADGGLVGYGPRQVEQAYNVNPLYAKDETGRGVTIAIVDSYGSPTIARDLQTFDAECGLENPSLRVIAPAGKIPPFNPNNSDMTGWADETTLDVEWAHAMAPGANILLVETPVSETEGVHGFPQIVQAENYILRRKMADVISQSFGATEQTFPNKQSLLSLRSAYINAQRDHVTVVSATNDTGATGEMLNGHTLYKHRAVGWPSSDPLVTAVGGTYLQLDGNGNRLAPDSVWQNASGASGGGTSTVFTRPSWQNSVRSVTGTMRGTPDVSMSASTDGPVAIYESYPGAPGWTAIGGDSEATPMFAGMVAIADELAHRPLGLINPALYAMGTSNTRCLTDVTRGNNSFAGVRGFNATVGYDMASGLGTPDNGSVFIRALARSATSCTGLG